MKYLVTLSLAGVLSSCSLVPFLGGKLAGDAEVFAEAAAQGAQAALEAEIHGDKCL